MTASSTTTKNVPTTIITSHKTDKKQKEHDLNIKVIPDDKLHVSEPNPHWFGNSANPSNDPSWTNDNWLKSRFHFSFAEYNNWDNASFGVLRVMNDDLVQPHRGFGTHPHRNMEILTYVVEGKLTHQDSMGTKETLGRGSIQFMTAGSGVRHSEYNHGDKPLRFIQTWIQPSDYNLPPNYGSSAPPTTGDAADRRNALQHLVSDSRRQDESSVAPVHISQDVDVYAAELDLGKSVTLDVGRGRQAYLLCVEGGVLLNGTYHLSRHDASEITGDGGKLDIEATHVEEAENGSNVAHVLVFVMKAVPGAGRTDI